MGEQKPEKTKKHICAGLLAHVKADSTALKSIRSFEENAPMTFSQTEITGYRSLVAFLIS